MATAGSTDVGFACAPMLIGCVGSVPKNKTINFDDNHARKKLSHIIYIKETIIVSIICSNLVNIKL